jgi:aerobic carbon-monoxide dehydrogenase medium subunit
LSQALTQKHAPHPHEVHAVPGLAVHRSRRLIPALAVDRPSTLGEVCDLLARTHGEAMICAGGVDVISRLKFGAPPTLRRLVYLGSVAQLSGVRRTETHLEIGAATPHAAVAENNLVVGSLPALAEYIDGLGNIRIRLQGTIGGNVMAREPNYEILPALQALDAALTFVDPVTREWTSVPARGFDRSHVGERLLVRIAIPLHAWTLRWVRRLRPLAGLVAAFHWKDGRLLGGAAVLTGGPLPSLCAEIQCGGLTAEELARHGADLVRDWADRLPAIGHALEADTTYRRQVVRVLLRRILAESAA